MKQRAFLKLLIFGLLLIWLGLFLAQSINLTTADLGRHLKNGEVFLDEFFQYSFGNEVLSKNFYSYNHLDFSFQNHHWGSGVVFFVVWQLFGFSGLSLFFIFLNLLAFSIFFWIAGKKSNFPTAFLFAVLLIPLIGNRAEIRPEVFSNLFAAIFVAFLFLFREGKISFKILAPSLFLLQVLWVNLHIYFVLGPIILASFILEEIIKRRSKNRIKNLLFCFLLVLVALLISPQGWQIFNLLFIFQDYGYLTIENQSIGFLEGLGLTNPNFFLYKAAALLLLISSIFVLIKKWPRPPLFFYLPTFLLAALAFLAIRNFSLFALFALPALSFNSHVFKNWLNEKHASVSQTKWLLFFIGVAAVFSFNFFSQFNNFSTVRSSARLGLLPEVNGSANFFKENSLSGPVFNNYDIGSYLIFHLFPEEKIFVDNRPEAYPAGFFQNVYIPLQEDEGLWEEKSKESQFNVIFFYRHDITPWAQPFLIKRIKDPDWFPVFVDDYAIILLKRNEINKNVIEKYEIPQEYFRIIKTDDSFHHYSGF